MNNKRVMIAAAKSGSGKTLITCGLLSYLKNSGHSVKSYKCGPDYIDPMFHRQVLGISGSNLDSYFAEDEKLRQVIGTAREDVAVLEGVMGIYDGLGGTEIKGSCYDVARATTTPVVLIIDAYGSGRTIISVIKGILEDDSENLIRGIILNRITKNFYDTIRATVEQMLVETGRDICLLGYVEKIKDVSIESRHLGLKQPWEIQDINSQLETVGQALAQTLDMDKLWNIISGAQSIDSIVSDEENIHTGLKLAVARDEAFCFYYEDNLQLFRDKGIEIVEFSPLRDERLPEGVHGLLLGGGYPELFLDELSSNETMKKSIADAITGGMPSLAECGGFMYLHKRIYDGETAYSMVGLVDGECRKLDRMSRFGYLELSGKEWISGIKCHEFHYYDSSSNGEAAVATKPVTHREWKCMHIDEKNVWGFPHLYYPSKEEFINKFIIKMQEYTFMN